MEADVSIAAICDSRLVSYLRKKEKGQNGPKQRKRSTLRGHRQFPKKIGSLLAGLNSRDLMDGLSFQKAEKKEICGKGKE
jgi:hypothetical protein